MIEATLLKLTAAVENIPIPNGENRPLWDLVTGPYTGLLGPFFWTVMIGLVTGLIWIKTQTVGPAFSFFIVANAVFAVLMPGGAAGYFTLLAIVGVVVLFLKLLTR